MRTEEAYIGVPTITFEFPDLPASRRPEANSQSPAPRSRSLILATALACLLMPLGVVAQQSPSAVDTVRAGAHYDAGRVFVATESSDCWHFAYGGGVWFGPIDREHTVHLLIAQGESLRFSAGIGVPY